MPKEKRTVSEVLKAYVREFQDFSTDGSVLFCKYCSTVVTATKKYQIQQHLRTTKHSKLKEVNLKQKHQPLVTTALVKPGPTRSKFNEDLCKAFVSANIPLAKLNNKNLVQFLQEYTKQPVPDESTIRKNYVPELYKVMLGKLREKADGKYIWVSLDETTDVDQRYVANFVFGILGEEEEREKSYLLNMAVLPKVNHSTVAAFFNDALSCLWPSGILYDHVLVACTDAAPYMCKAMGGLGILYPKMIHVTCVAHGLHRVAETVRASFPEVNALISTVKRVFLKAPSRKKFFLDAVHDVPLPPSPVHTRWGTWLEAAVYYADYFEVVKKLVQDLDSEEAASIKEAQEVLSKDGVREQLIFIRSNLLCIPSAIKKLQEKGLPLHISIGIVEEVERSLMNLTNQVFSEKLQSVVLKNSGLLKLKSISGVIQGKDKIDSASILEVSDFVKLEYAPIVACDVERVFSEYKVILSENRRKFVFENLLHHAVIKCNQDL